MHDDSPLPQAIDMAALQEITGGDADFERDLIQTFIESGDRSLAEILAALGRKDFFTIARRAHSIKGSSANIRADGLSKVADKLEQAAERNAEGEVSLLVTDLAARLEEVTAQLARFG